MKNPGEIILKVIEDRLEISQITAAQMGTTIQELGADSLDLIEMTVSLEEALGIDITDEEAVKILGATGHNTVFQAKNEVDALVVRRERKRA